MRLGEYQKLVVIKKVEFGVYLAEHMEDETRVLLPEKQVPEGTKIGEELRVFLYKDSKDRLIATTNAPKLTLGGLAVLTVKEGKLKAVVSITIDNEFVVHDIKVIEGEKGLFIAMPSKKALDGEYRDIAHPINSGTREKIQNTILDRYQESLEADTEESGEM